jgi:hypothetical protein
MAYRIWRLHVLLGTPMAALAHSVLQFARDYRNDAGWWHDLLWVFPAHFVLGILVGGVILVPAYSLQGGVAVLLTRWRCPALVQAILGGALQAGLATTWARTVGIEPSLSGNFQLTPAVIAAAFGVGATVALTSAHFNRRKPASGDRALG